MTKRSRSTMDPVEHEENTVEDVQMNENSENDQGQGMKANGANDRRESGQNKKKRSVVRWNEENLRENEVIRREVIDNMRLHRQTIDEAKTPYVQYEEDTIDSANPVAKVRFSGVSILPLEEGGEEARDSASGASSSSAEGSPAEGGSESDDDDDDEHRDEMRGITVQFQQENLISPREVQTHFVEPRDQMEQLKQAFDSHDRRNAWESESEDENAMMTEDASASGEGLTAEEKKKIFKEKRKRHYSEYLVMKRLREAGQLTDEEEEDEKVESAAEKSATPSHESSDQQFEEKRRQHYNEFLVMKRLRESGQLADEDEENEEEDGKEENKEQRK